ncbi:PUTATIVE Lipoprotein, putative [Mesomycoplasma conjunctivae]|uniref:PUTATIVE Lipoprotein, putative n=2 Tax=Mesomycoplasma conjunctivae TaxID=45361 RepID=C5J613_MESCH|nr:PUTATIVE Lipoprotein, putative [Mesomycoplasma conjunctivae]
MMKKSLKKLFIFGSLSPVSLLPLIALSCAKLEKKQDDKSNATNNQKKQDDKSNATNNQNPTPGQQIKAKTTFEVKLNTNENIEFKARFKNFVNQLNQASQSNDDFVNVSVNFLGQSLSKKFTKDEFMQNIFNKVEKFDFTNLKPDIGTEEIFVQFETQSDAKEFETLLQKEFNNFYVTEKWFTNELKNAIDKVIKTKLIKNGKISLDDAKKNNKETEYQAAEKMILDFLKSQNVTLEKDIRITKINQDIRPAWSLNIELTNTKNNIKTKNVKLDFKKPKSDWNDNKINEENRVRTIGAKLANQLSELFDNSFIENLGKTIYLMVLIDDKNVISKVLSEKISKFIVNSLKKVGTFAFLEIKFIDRQANKLVNKIITPLVTKIENAAKNK